MKYFGYGCLLPLAGWFAAALAVSLFLQWQLGVAPSATIGVALLAGGLGWAGAGLLYSALGRVSDHLALRAALGGREPQPGAGAVAVGTLQPRGALLQSPFGGGECVAYEYAVNCCIRAGSQRRITTCYNGVGVVPCTIASAAGHFRLLAVPELDPATTAAVHTSRSKALRYVAKTSFAPRSTSARELLERWSDADGNYRSDVGPAEAAPQDLSECQLEHRLVRADSPVCVTGYYDPARRAFVTPPAWAPMTRIYAGPTQPILKAMTRAALLRGAIGLALVLAALGIVAAFVADV